MKTRIRMVELSILLVTLFAVPYIFGFSCNQTSRKEISSSNRFSNENNTQSTSYTRDTIVIVDNQKINIRMETIIDSTQFYDTVKYSVREYGYSGRIIFSKVNAIDTINFSIRNFYPFLLEEQKMDFTIAMLAFKKTNKQNFEFYVNVHVPDTDNMIRFILTTTNKKILKIRYR